MTGRAAPRAAAGVIARRTPGHLPWPPLLISGAAAGAAIGIPVARGQGAVAAAQVAGLALAAAAGYLLDDPAAAVTQTVPRPLWRRRSATVVRGLAVLATAWMVLLTLLEWRVGGFAAGPLTIDTTVTALLALTAAALLARRGEPEPGNLIAPAVVLAGIGAMLLQPLLGVTLFLSADEESATRLGGWAGVAIVAVLILLAAWRDPAGRRRGRSRTLWTTRAPAPGDPVSDAPSTQRGSGSREQARAASSGSRIRLVDAVKNPGVRDHGDAGGRASSESGDDRGGRDPRGSASSSGSGVECW